MLFLSVGQARRIFIHKAADMPMTWRNQQYWQYQQEQNILYVALTRSQEELFIVGEPDWYKPFVENEEDVEF